MQASVQAASCRAASRGAPRCGGELGLLMADVSTVGQEGKDGWTHEKTLGQSWESYAYQSHRNPQVIG